MYIIKASGEKEKFQPQKIRRTCLRAGADKRLADEVINKIKRNLYPGITSREIFKLIKKYLRQTNPITAIRYSLKEAIFRLGPAGFPFEKYIARILDEYDYKVSLNNIVIGRCVKHEIDIIAKNQKNNYLIECKYHHAPGFYCGLKEVLYTWARFLDVNKIKGRKKFDLPWMITNTKFSQSAIQYANCQGIRLLGWHWPRKESLEDLIEAKRLYPITILPNLTDDLKIKLARVNLIVCQDLLANNLNQAIRKIKIKHHVIQQLVNQARDLIFNHPSS